MDSREASDLKTLADMSKQRQQQTEGGHPTFNLSQMHKGEAELTMAHAATSDVIAVRPMV